MAKIPTAETYGARPVPIETGFIAKPPMPQTSGTEYLASSLNVMGERFQKIQDENDKTHAEAAYNELIKKRQDLTVGQDGFVYKQGQDALSTPIMKDYGDLFQKAEDEISSKLQNDQQKKYFKERADVASLQFRQDILNHLVKEQDSYATQTFKDTIQTETDNAANRYRDPKAIQMSIVRMENAVNTEADRKGWSKETKQSAMTEVKSGAYRGVIERMLSNGQDLDAKSYYEGLKKQDQKNPIFTTKDRNAIESALHVGSVKGESQRRADELVAKNQDDLKNALDQARQIKDPELRDATVQRVKGHIADNETAIKLNHDEAFTHAYQVVEQTGSTANIEPKYHVRLSRTDLSYLDLRASEIRDNRIPEQNPKAWEDFNYISRDYKALAGMSDSDFFGRYWVNFDDAHRKRAVSLREAAISAVAGDQSASTKLEDHVTFETRMLDTLHRLNIVDPNKTANDIKKDEDLSVLVGNFRKEADAQIREYQAAHGLKYVDGDTKQKIMDQLALQKYMKVNVERPWFDQKGVSVYQLTAEQRKLAYVPFDQISPVSQEKIFNFAKSEGIIPRTMPMSTFLNNYRSRIERARFADIEGAGPNDIVQILRGK